MHQKDPLSRLSGRGLKDVCLHNRTSRRVQHGGSDLRRALVAKSHRGRRFVPAMLATIPTRRGGRLLTPTGGWQLALALTLAGVARQRFWAADYRM